MRGLLSFFGGFFVHLRLTFGERYDIRVVSF